MSRVKTVISTSVHVLCVLALTTAAPQVQGQAVIIGSQQLQAVSDGNAAGQAEAFKTSASGSGTVVSLTIYVDAGSGSSKLVAGLYTDSAGKPGTLLTQGTLNAPSAGAWNAITVPTVQVTAGANYWIAILSPAGSGSIKFRDKSGGTRSETSASKTLTTLPAVWATGAVFADSPLSAYATSAGSVQPILSVSPGSVSFTYTQGGIAPASVPLTISNTGGSSLSFTSVPNANWLSVAPSSGTAPQTEQVSASVMGLAAGTYAGQITVTATGAQGSPISVPVTLVVSAPTSQAVLSVSPQSVTVNYTLSASAPSPVAVTVANTGTGLLSFTASTNTSWLTVTPSSGTATQVEQISVLTDGLAAGTYSGQITIAAETAQHSPIVIPVTLNVAAAQSISADWPMVNRDPSRSGFAANDATITPANAGRLALQWTAPVDGKVVAQPLYLAAVQVMSQVHDVVVAATTQNSLYAIDANSGTQLWKRNFGADFGGCQPPGGSGIRSAPAVDRNSGRIYLVTDDGTLRTVALVDGTDVAPSLPIIDLPATNKVRGGLNLFGNNLYIASGSGGCDAPPWRGRIFRVDLSAAAPVLGATFDVIPSIAGNSRGGGIWGYGGVAVDPASGNVYAATGADANEKYTPYGVRMLALSSTLTLLGSYEPPHPATFPCNGAPCDIDFGATPIVFQPAGCPLLVAAGNKNGSLYVLRAQDLAASGPLWQSVAVNAANDWLGNGGLGGVPAYWPDGRMLFVTDSGSGIGGVSAGIVALSVLPSPACTLQLAWSTALPDLGSAMSSPVVANGVVFVGEGASGRVHGYNASTGEALWTSGTTITGGTYAAPSIGGGKLFVGSWNGQSAADSGAIRAFAVDTTTPPPPPNPCTGAQPAVLLGTQTIGNQSDSNALGAAEAFQTTAAGCGSVGSINVYVDAGSTAAKIAVGLYTDNSGHPGTLLAQGSTSQPLAGQWNTIPIATASVTQGTKYWIGILGAQSGIVRFRDVRGGCMSESSAASNLTSLPTTWTTGSIYTDCPLSAYGNATP